MRRYPLLFASFVALAAFAAGQQEATKPIIRKVQAKRTAAWSGQEMFNEYCVACHGKGGKGDGPAAPALKSAVPDLTAEAARHGGKFPEAKVLRAIKGDPDLIAHGSPEMPVWGAVLHGRTSQDGEETMRLRNLVEYIKTLK